MKSIRCGSTRLLAPSTSLPDGGWFHFSASHWCAELKPTSTNMKTMKNTKGYKITFSTTNRGEQVEYFFRRLRGLTLDELVSERLQQLKENSYVINDSIQSSSATRTLSGATSINLLT